MEEIIKRRNGDHLAPCSIGDYPNRRARLAAHQNSVENH